MNSIKRITISILAAGLIASTPLAGNSAFAQSVEKFGEFLGADAPTFATPEEAIDGFKQKLLAGDLAGLSTLLGLNPDKVKAAEDIGAKIDEMKTAAGKLFTVEVDGDQRIIELGDEVWPFPFPVRKGKDDKWAFDSIAGLEEIINRRVGENEINAISTEQTYVDAQKEYASTDRNGDGVLEYAQKLVSTPGKTDGLYWPADQGSGESPAGGALNQAQLDKAARGEGYFGYKFRILTRQGGNVAGGAYNYIVNGNMISGFGLLAWPAKYGRTGIDTFVVNQAGIVYQKDLGVGTEAAAAKIQSFNPDATWSLADK